MTTAHDPTVLPADIPAPRDDGAARHLQGARLPSVSLAATDGSKVDLSKLPGRTVLYLYPRTGVPGQAPPDGWDQIPGARGCTPQSCSFRDHFAELKRLGVSRLYGLSTQDTAYQREAVERLHLPFPVLSDEKSRTGACDQVADVHGRRHDVAETHGADPRRRHHHEGVLPRVPAGQERRGGDRLAPQPVGRDCGPLVRRRPPRIIRRSCRWGCADSAGANPSRALWRRRCPDKRAPPRIRLGTSSASARPYWYCSASNDS